MHEAKPLIFNWFFQVNYFFIILGFRFKFIDDVACRHDNWTNKSFYTNFPDDYMTEVFVEKEEVLSHKIINKKCNSLVSLVSIL